jgi:hypothetical protein
MQAGYRTDDHADGGRLGLNYTVPVKDEALG